MGNRLLSSSGSASRFVFYHRTLFFNMNFLTLILDIGASKGYMRMRCNCGAKQVGLGGPFAKLVWR